MPPYNGVYTHDSTHEGWPVLKNANDKYCYRYAPKDRWLLSSHFTSDKDKCAAYIVATEGPLPVGAHTWKSFEAIGPKPWPWKDFTFTVGLQGPG